MYIVNLFVSMLESSQQEQSPVIIYLSNHALSGIVSHVYPDVVELRTEDGKRCAIALNRIEAITAN